MDIPYTLVRSKRKTVALIVQPDGSLLVRAPLRLARRAIEEFIAQKSEWIRSRQEMAHAAPPAPPSRQYHSGEVFTFLGKKYPLEITAEAGSAGRPAAQSALIPAARSPRPPHHPSAPARTGEPSAEMLPGFEITTPSRRGEAHGMLTGLETETSSRVLRPYPPETPPRMPRGQILELASDRFRLSQAAQGRAAEVFTAWYKQQARRVLEERVKWFATRFGLKVSGVRISSARTRWGSCSSRGSLSFTWRLVIAPLEVIDYVVAHELAHLRVKNHSPAFWREVESILPDYKARQKWLNTNGKTLEL